MKLTIPSVVVASTFPYTPSDQEDIRFFALGIYCVLMIVDVWIIISLIHFGIKTKKWLHLQRGNPDLLSSGWIYLSVIFCSVLAFVYHLVIALYYNLEYQIGDDELCDSMSDAAISLFGFCAFSVYFFLWLRQRVLYTTVLPTIHFTKALKVFSFMIIFITLMFGVTTIILSNIPNDAVATPMGCIYKKDGNLREISLVFAAFAFIFTQVSLLAVFIYALLVLHESSHEERWKILVLCNCKSSNEQTNVTEQPTDRTRTMIYNEIRKTIIFAVLSLFSDLLAVFLELLFLEEGKRNDYIGVWAVLAVSMNLYFVILSFVKWKDMIASFCKCYNSR